MKIKSIHLAIIGIFTLIIMGFSQDPSEEYYEIGDVKYSILPPNVFGKTQKGTWVLLDGKPIGDDQKLYTFLEQEFILDMFKDKNGIAKLPDAKGRFIRSMNINGQGSDPNKTRKVGSYQGDALKKHKHPLQNVIYKHGRSFRGDNAKDHALKHAYGSVWASETKVTGNDDESRPRNIALYTYIKTAN